MRSPKATTAAIIERDGKLLLTKRAGGEFKGSWCIPGGHIELGETPKQAIIREIKEEVGLIFTPEFFNYFPETFPERDWYAVVLIFHGPVTGEVETNEEVSEWKWVTLKEAVQYDLAFTNKQVIEAWMKRGAA